MIDIQINENKQIGTKLYHTLPLPPCCPYSGNPLAGSSITIEYTAKHFFLEVDALKTFLDTYRGGKGDVRSMEGMIQDIAQACANVLLVRVGVSSFLRINPGQVMRVVCSAIPK